MPEISPGNRCAPARNYRGPHFGPRYIIDGTIQDTENNINRNENKNKNGGTVGRNNYINTRRASAFSFYFPDVLFSIKIKL